MVGPLCLTLLAPMLASLVTGVHVDNGLVDSELVKECVSNNSVDLVLLLDASGSVGGDTFQLQLNFASHLAGRLNVSHQGSHMAIIQYAETPQLEISLSQYTNLNQVGASVELCPRFDPSLFFSSSFSIIPHLLSLVKNSF